MQCFGHASRGKSCLVYSSLSRSNQCNRYCYLQLCSITISSVCFQTPSLYETPNSSTVLTNPSSAHQPQSQHDIFHPQTNFAGTPELPHNLLSGWLLYSDLLISHTTALVRSAKDDSLLLRSVLVVATDILRGPSRSTTGPCERLLYAAWQVKEMKGLGLDCRHTLLDRGACIRRSTCRNRASEVRQYKPKSPTARRPAQTASCTL
jgi:hypothetical protein